MRLHLWQAPFLAAAVALPACGGGGGTVEVGLSEFAVAVQPASVGAGEITFEVTNNGPNDPHEFVVVRTDLPVDQLPTKEDGSYDETAAGAEVIDEIEEFEVGRTESITLDLEPGAYVLLCNLVEEEDGKLEAHYAEGMRAPFTVE
jgi:uncharacterized cupredoxin-like copper-binding protein